MTHFSDPVIEIDSRIAVLRMAQRAHVGDLAAAQSDAVAAMAREQAAHDLLADAEARIISALETIDEYAGEIRELSTEREVYIPPQRAVPSGT